MATRAEIQAQMQALQSELDKADTDDEVWAKGDDGREYKVTGRRATAVLKRLGLADILDQGDDDGAQGDDAEGDVDPDPEPKGGYFGRGKK